MVLLEVFFLSFCAFGTLVGIRFRVSRQYR
jgi:hypothetical protein